jgi:hypothetical protein
MKIEKDRKYKIRGKSKYFLEKYGMNNPVIEIEDLWINVSGESWMQSNGNPACLLFAIRTGLSGEKYSYSDDKVYYGKIGGMGELVCEDELEEISK